MQRDKVIWAGLGAACLLALVMLQQATAPSSPATGARRKSERPSQRSRHPHSSRPRREARVASQHKQATETGPRDSSNRTKSLAEECPPEDKGSSQKHSVAKPLHSEFSDVKGDSLVTVDQSRAADGSGSREPRRYAIEEVQRVDSSRKPPLSKVARPTAVVPQGSRVDAGANVLHVTASSDSPAGDQAPAKRHSSERPASQQPFQIQFQSIDSLDRGSARVRQPLGHAARRGKGDPAERSTGSPDVVAREPAAPARLPPGFVGARRGHSSTDGVAGSSTRDSLRRFPSKGQRSSAASSMGTKSERDMNQKPEGDFKQSYVKHWVQQAAVGPPVPLIEADVEPLEVVSIIEQRGDSVATAGSCSALGDGEDELYFNRSLTRSQAADLQLLAHEGTRRQREEEHFGLTPAPPAPDALHSVGDLTMPPPPFTTPPALDGDSSTGSGEADRSAGAFPRRQPGRSRSAAPETSAEPTGSRHQLRPKGELPLQPTSSLRDKLVKSSGARPLNACDADELLDGISPIQPMRRSCRENSPGSHPPSATRHPSHPGTDPLVVGPNGHDESAESFTVNLSPNTKLRVGAKRSRERSHAAQSPQMPRHPIAVEGLRIGVVCDEVLNTDSPDEEGRAPQGTDHRQPQSRTRVSSPVTESSITPVVPHDDSARAYSEARDGAKIYSTPGGPHRECTSVNSVTIGSAFETRDHDASVRDRRCDASEANRPVLPGELYALKRLLRFHITSIATTPENGSPWLDLYNLLVDLSPRLLGLLALPSLTAHLPLLPPPPTPPHAYDPALHQLVDDVHALLSGRYASITELPARVYRLSPDRKTVLVYASSAAGTPSSAMRSRGDTMSLAEPVEIGFGREVPPAAASFGATQSGALPALLVDDGVEAAGLPVAPPSVSTSPGHVEVAGPPPPRPAPATMKPSGDDDDDDAAIGEALDRHIRHVRGLPPPATSPKALSPHALESEHHESTTAPRADHLVNESQVKELLSMLATPEAQRILQQLQRGSSSHGVTSTPSQTHAASPLAASGNRQRSVRSSGEGSSEGLRRASHEVAPFHRVQSSVTFAFQGEHGTSSPYSPMGPARGDDEHGRHGSARTQPFQPRSQSLGGSTEPQLGDLKFHRSKSYGCPRPQRTPPTSRYLFSTRTVDGKAQRSTAPGVDANSSQLSSNSSGLGSRTHATGPGLGRSAPDYHGKSRGNVFSRLYPSRQESFFAGSHHDIHSHSIGGDVTRSPLQPLQSLGHGSYIKLKPPMTF